MVHVRVRAASWVDVDRIDLVVDGEITTIDIEPEDADLSEPAIRFEKDLSIDVPNSASYVIVAAYGDDDLAPLHPGRAPFGVTNPIFISR